MNRFGNIIVLVSQVACFQVRRSQPFQTLSVSEMAFRLQIEGARKQYKKHLF
jgi:hypothetical protein